MEKMCIVPNLTKAQQVSDKKLREEVKALRLSGVVGVKILRGEVVRGGGCGEVSGSVN